MLTSGTEFKNAALRMRVQQKCTPATTAGLVLNGAVNTTHAGTGEKCSGKQAFSFPFGKCFLQKQCFALKPEN